jgi:hypothetical protein
VPGARRGACPESVFQAEDARSREIAGIIRRGEEVVSGALVRVEPVPLGAGGARPSAPTLTPISTLTNTAGVFLGLRNVPYRYDLLARLDPPEATRQDILVFRGLATRYNEPALEGPRTFDRAWSTNIDLALDRGVPAGRSLAFFVNAEPRTLDNDVLGVTGDVTHGLTILTRSLSRNVVLHVIEHETAGGLAKTTAVGNATVVVDGGPRRLVEVRLEEVKPEAFTEARFDVAAPPGFTVADVDIRIGFTRTSDALVASIPAGTSLKVPFLVGGNYTYQAKATRADGASSESGEKGIALGQTTKVTLAAPSSAAAPLDGEARGARESLVVDGAGPFEHILVPVVGGPSMRIFTAQHETTLPDLTTLALPAATGAYTWTIRSFEVVPGDVRQPFVESLAGLDSQRYRARATSSPRTIVLR